LIFAGIGYDLQVIYFIKGKICLPDKWLAKVETMLPWV